MAEIGIGMIGYKFMGRAHSNGWRQVSHFFDVDPQPRLRAICGRDEAATRDASITLGWEGYETDARQLIARDDIGIVDVCTPGNTHHDLALAAIQAGKHVICEKPLANTLAEAREMRDAAAQAGVVNMVNFNYRRVPAVQLAKRLIAEGRIGTVRHWRAVYLQDWIVDPEFPLVWRLRKELAGSGALGDLGAHIIDLAHYLVGPITSVSGATETFIKERPLESASASRGLAATGSSETGQVTVDDAVIFLARFATGAIGTFEATRFATGRKNYNSFEINGSRGSIVFNLERLNELQVYSADDPADAAGFRTILVTDASQPFAGAWWPGGHIIGWEHTFTHGFKDFLDGVRTGQSPAPDFAAGYRCQAVLDAVERSAASGAWATPEE